MSLLDRLRGWVDQRSAAHESDGAEDGLLSYASEWHALVIGVGIGVAAAFLGRPELAGGALLLALGVKGAEKITSQKVLGELSKEPWYGAFGVLAGVAVGFLARPLF